jgi:hypothetical protein
VQKLSNKDNPRLAAALRFARAGSPIVLLHGVRNGKCGCRNPNCAAIGKHPATPHGVQDATRDEATIRRWFRESPQSNFGLATGKRSGIVVLDVDPRHGGTRSLKQFEHTNGPLPDGPRVRSGAKGLHYYFANRKDTIKSKRGILRGIDVCGDGSYVVLPPSKHASRRLYRWLHGKSLSRIPMPPLPESLLRLMRQKSRRQPRGERLIVEGKRNSTLASLAGSMRHRSFSQQAIEAALFEENRLCCDPPLPETEVLAIARSIGRYPPGIVAELLEPEPLPKDDWRLKPLRGKWIVNLPEGLFLDYLVLPPGIAFVAALWVIATRVFQEFDSYPYLTITSPVKRCGKTRFGEILELLCRPSLISVNISEAALFRIIDHEKPTLIVDEAEALRNRTTERAQYLLSILQAGYKKGAVVPRCVGKNHEIEKFSVYCPKAILAIGNLPDTLMDRSIVVSMRRRLPTEPVARFRRRLAAEQTYGIVNNTDAWVAAYKDQIMRAYLKQKLDFLRDREAEIWEPLFAIAEVAVPERLEELKRIAIRLSTKKASADEDDSQALQLLSDIRTIFTASKRNALPSAEVVEKLKKNAADHYDEQFTQLKLARLLRPFGVSSQQIWAEDRNTRGYRRGDFKSAFERYLEPE